MENIFIISLFLLYGIMKGKENERKNHFQCYLIFYTYSILVDSFHFLFFSFLSFLCCWFSFHFLFVFPIVTHFRVTCKFLIPKSIYPLRSSSAVATPLSFVGFCFSENMAEKNQPVAVAPIIIAGDNIDIILLTRNGSLERRPPLPMPTIRPPRAHPSG